jgi:hypothetical protein
MSTNNISDLTVEELRILLREEMRSLIRETVQEVLEELTDDVEDGVRLKPEVEAQLQRFLHDQPDGESVDDILTELDLNGE